VSIRLSPPSASGPSALREDGPWAWFKILDKATIAPDEKDPETFNVTFDVGGRRALYKLRASSALSDFRLEELKQFRCPERL
jgi:type VI secretion system protein ImpL